MLNSALILGYILLSIGLLAVLEDLTADRGIRVREWIERAFGK